MLATLLLAMLLLRELDAAYSGFRPGEVWLDTDGNRIKAHQPHISGPHEGVYYWYGIQRVGAKEAGSSGVVNVYTSSDLYNWRFRGAAYNESKYAARPSLLGKNPSTGKWVLWAKGGKSFQSAEADSPLGPFHQVGSFSPTSDSKAGDSASYLDPVTGEAYYVYSQHLPSRAMKVLKLDATWTKPTGQEPWGTVAGNLEAPAPFYSPVTGKRYIWSSHTSGWSPNPAALLAAGAMEGPWATLGNPSGDRETFGTQGSHVLPLAVVNGRQRLLYMADRYEPFIDTEEGGRYIMLPLEVSKDGTVLLRNASHWSIEAWPTTDAALV